MYRFIIFTYAISLVSMAFCKDTVRWDFNNLDGWKDGSQNNSPQNYMVKDGKLRMHTRANTRDRVKIHRNERYKAGSFSWRIYIPQMGTGDQASIGAFLYHDDKREFDFEIGYGTAKIRKKLKANTDEMVCYCTSQGLPFSSSPHLIKAKLWYTFTIQLKETEAGTYQILWFIDGKTVKSLQTKIKTSIDFTLFLSVENLIFIGDHIPKQENYALFDWVEYISPK